MNRSESIHVPANDFTGTQYRSMKDLTSVRKCANMAHRSATSRSKK